MDDVITEAPPPSRLLPEDINNFTPPPTSLPSPFLVFPAHNSENTLRPPLLIVAISSPSLHFLHHLTPKSLVGSFILPENPLTGISVGPHSLSDKSCNVYALGSIFIILVQCHVSPERAHAVARALIGGRIVPERVLILDSIQSCNFRGRLSRDEPVAFKLETSTEKGKQDESSLLVKGIGYYPSGSVVDGLGSALLARCQLLRIEGTLLVSWPNLGKPVMDLVKSVLVKDVLSGVEYSVDEGYEDEYLKLSRRKDRTDSDLYT